MVKFPLVFAVNIVESTNLQPTRFESEARSQLLQLRLLRCFKHIPMLSYLHNKYTEDDGSTYKDVVSLIVESYHTTTIEVWLS